VFGRKIRHPENSPLRSSILFASPEDMYRPRSQLAAGLPRQDHVWITIKQLVRFHKNEFDEMLCKLDFAKYACAFQQNSILGPTF